MPDDRERGLEYHATGDLDRAIEAYTRALNVQPADAMTIYARALAHQAQGDLQAAIDDYDQVLRLRPNGPSVFTIGQPTVGAFSGQG